jgi:acetyl esterase/lipase
VFRKDVPSEHERRLLVHTHGGAYVFAAGEAGLAEAALVAYFSNSPVLSVDYRMPPDHPFPAAVEDVVTVWRKMLESHDRANAAMFGSSAGGGLTMAVTLKLKQLGIPLPAALYLGSPWAHLGKCADSLFANEKTDNLLFYYDGLLGAAAQLYAGHLPLNDPLLSPLEGDLSGFPPSIILSGTRDLFLSLAALTHRKLRQAGVDAQLHIFEAASHIEYLAFPAPECVDAMNEVGRFFDQHLAQ